jgi:hypothetical protein
MLCYTSRIQIKILVGKNKSVLEQIIKSINHKHERVSIVCSPLTFNWRFRGTRRLLSSLFASCWFLVWLILRSWRWLWYVLPKRRVTFAALYPRTGLYITTAMRTSNTTNSYQLCKTYINMYIKIFILGQSFASVGHKLPTFRGPSLSSSSGFDLIALSCVGVPCNL